MAHHHHHHSKLTRLNLGFALAIFLNSLFVGVEIIFALVANSMSLLSDAAHNCGDILGLVLAWGANYLLKRPANERYSYGYKKLTIVTAFLNALLLILSLIFIGYESIISLIHTRAINEHLVIGVAIAGVLVNGGTALLFMRENHADLNIKGAFLHLAYDALISLGVVFSAVLIALTRWQWLDATVALMIVVILSKDSWRLLRRSVSLILGAVPDEIDRSGVLNYLRCLPGVSGIHDVHIWALSTAQTALTAHLVMPESGLADQDYQRINQDLRERFSIHHVTLQVERGHRAYPCIQSDLC
jgi:cobalt-zinc-cadmium efflux system protein